MRKKLLTILVLVFSSCQCYSQDVIRLKGPKRIFKTDRAPQLVYVGLGGAAIGLSVNYDRRFNKKVDGLGFNGGIGFSIGEPRYKYTTIPLGINYLVGNTQKGRYLEIGLSETIFKVGDFNYNSSTLLFANSFQFVGETVQENTTYNFTTFLVGYRSQPNYGGFNFRGGINPILFKSKTALGAYLSLGYNF